MKERLASMEEWTKQVKHIAYKKLNSLLRLEKNGLNTPEYIVIQNAEEVENAADLFRSWGRVSVRTDAPHNMYRLPFYPAQLPTDAVRLIKEYLTKNPDCIAIPLKTVTIEDSVIAGNYVDFRNESYMEVFLGPGTIREKIDDGNGKDLFTINTTDCIVGQLSPNVAPLKAVLKRVISDCIYLPRPIIVEWSYYPYQVGKNGKNIIYWEVR